MQRPYGIYADKNAFILLLWQCVVSFLPGDCLKIMIDTILAKKESLEIEIDAQKQP